MARLRPAPPRYRSNLIALATVAVALAAAPKAQAEGLPEYRDYYWSSGDGNFSDYWEDFTGQFVHPDWGWTTLYFGKDSDGNSGPKGGTVFNDERYNLPVVGLGFYDHDWILDGKSLKMIDFENFLGAKSPNISVTVNASIRLDGFFGNKPHLSLEVSPGSTLTINGNIDGKGSLYKSDYGTAVLHGLHTYTEGTYLTAGRLIDYHPNGNYDTNALLEFHIDGDTTFGGSIAGGGGFTKSGYGTLDLSGSVGYTGATVVDEGRLILQVPKSSGVTIAGGAAFETKLAQSSQVGTYAGKITGEGYFTKSGAGTLTRTALNDYTGGTEVLDGTLIDLHPHGGYYNFGTLTFNVADDQTYAGSITGPGTLNKTGAGTLTHTGGNYTWGTTNVQAGRLIDFYPSPGNYSVSGGAALELRSITDQTYVGVVSGAGSFTKSGAGTLTLNGVNTYTGGTTVNAGRLIDRNPHGDYVTNADLEFATATNVDFQTPAPAGPARNNTISGTGAFTKSGAGALRLFGPLTYAGGTTINGGALVAVGNDLLPTATALTVGAGGTLIAAGSQTVASLSGAGSVVAGGAFTVSGAASTTFSGVVSGPGSLAKAGSGTLTLSGVNTYAGGTTVSGGRLIDANPHGAYVTNAALEFRNANDLTYATPISGKGSFTKSGQGTLTLSGANTYTGGTTVSAGRLIDLNPHGDYTTNAILEFSNASDAAYGRTIDGAGTFVKSGAGTLAFSGSIKPGVTTKIVGGVLKASGGGLYGDVFGEAGTTFQLDGSGNAPGAFSGAGALLKTGGGTFALSKAPTNTGGVRVSGGTLEVDGRGAFGGGLSVDAGATLANLSGGALTVNGVSLVQGAVQTAASATTAFTGLVSGAGNFKDRGTVEFRGGYNPGNSPASVRFNGDLKLASANILTMELGGTTLGTGYDHLTVDGTAFLGGALNVAWTGGFAASAGQSFDLFDFAHSGGTFATLNLPTLSNGLVWNTSGLYTSGTLSVQAVPEPASLAALGLGGLALLRRRKRA